MIFLPKSQDGLVLISSGSAFGGAVFVFRESSWNVCRLFFGSKTHAMDMRPPIQIYRELLGFS